MNNHQQLMDSLVQGTTWKCRMLNGAIFDYHTKFKITQAEARKHLLANANAWCDEDDPAYESSDIESIWKTKGR